MIKTKIYVWMCVRKTKTKYLAYYKIVSWNQFYEKELTGLWAEISCFKTGKKNKE